MDNTINVTCILSDEQYTRLEYVTKILKDKSKNVSWDNQMTLQLAIGTPYLTEMLLIMLENYVENN